MAEVRDDRRYTESHEWVKVDGDVAIVGVTDHAQDSLGDITFVEPPEMDSEVQQLTECCVVESVKAASDTYTPLSGVVCEINEALEDTPELINSSCYEDGWIFKLKDFDTAELDNLMAPEAYTKYLEENE